MNNDYLIRNNVSVKTPRKKFTRPIQVVGRPKYLLSPRSDVRYFHPELPNTEHQPDTHFDTTNIRDDIWVNKLTQINETAPNPKYKLLTKERSQHINSLQVFRDPSILPYTLRAPVQSVENELLYLTAELHPYNKTRIPAVYRISDTYICDDLGRIYERNRYGAYTWKQYTLTSEARDELYLKNTDGTYLKRSVYLFIGVAGYSPPVQSEFLYSLKYDFHHIEENKLDLRPTRIIPLEVRLHRFIHSKNLTAQVSGFFKSTGKWW